MASENNGVLKVAPETLKTKAAAFEEAGTQFKDTTQKMLNVVDEMTGAVWSGAAATEYKGKFDEFHAASEKMVAAISDYTAKLQDVASRYDTAENQNVQISASLNAQFGSLV